MSEWHVRPDQLDKRFTDEQVVVLFRARTKRLKRAAQAAKGESEEPTHRLSNAEFFQKYGIKPKTVTLKPRVN